ncbi:hypothetical protein ISS86_02930 [Candidatus Microgenomates bacterium]|nr:hypothetical protein [Candidatus Microgenomates bacterium]
MTVLTLKLKEDNEDVYISSSGVPSEDRKKQANKLAEIIKNGFLKLGGEFGENKPITLRDEKDILKKWYKMGKFLLKVARQFGVFNNNIESLFWYSLYDYLPEDIKTRPRPKRAREIARNHFRQITEIAKYSLKRVQSVGNWSIWREILDGKGILNDSRVLDWIIDELSDKDLPYKKIRKFIREIRKYLQKKDTTVLTLDRLINKLEPFKKYLL